MSTSKRKKQARQEQHRKEKAQRQYQKLLSTIKKTEREFVEYKPERSYVRETKHYPSLTPSNTIPGSCSRRESPRYTGTLIKGIATMHKSNAVPVINQQEAEDISKMRRN
jgi:hypothetical protein